MFKLSEYKINLKSSLKPHTVTFLVDGDLVLLGYKKKGFGKGLFVGIGGKVEENEPIITAAKREVREEINITVKNLKKMGIMNFYFPHFQNESWNQAVHLFISKDWEGIPKESEEIKPKWFEKDKIPFRKMWDDAKFWLPEILKNKNQSGEFFFSKSLKITKYLFE